MTPRRDAPREPAVPLTPDTYLNRELSWLAFNARVLAEAQDASLPLLERLKFIAIFSTNLDEFFMVRVASYHTKIKAGLHRARPDGYPPEALLRVIHDRTTAMITQQRAVLREIMDGLAQRGVQIVPIAALPADQRATTRRTFERTVFPVLTPLAVDYTRPFPFISNLSLSLVVWLRHAEGGDPEFVRIKVPEDVLPRLMPLSMALGLPENAPIPHEHEGRFVWLDELIADNLDMLFPGMVVQDHSVFRVTRNADIDYEFEQDDDSDLEDMSALIAASVRERRFGPVVRLSVPDTMSARTMSRLIEELDVDPQRDVYSIDGALGGSSLMRLVDVDRPDLKLPPYTPRVPAPLADANRLFEMIAAQDVLLHHPYDSFLPVEEFFRAAARDERVLAIKATLYRVGKNSPVVRALMDARDNGKQVAVLVELKARFDEENNLTWARQMEELGVHVTYGVEELTFKTHAKVALVVRREPDGVRRYVHLGTGNYNANTARLYEDIGLFTADERIASDASLLFNRLTGYAPATTYQRLLVAPEYLADTLLDLIDGEIAAAQAGRPAHIVMKMNQLEEDLIIAKLYQASQAGVQVDLIVRGLCCLRPGVPGLSDHIRVRSVVGRFLEHSRIFLFANAPADRVLLMGSADMMRRNLHNRVEVVFPVMDLALQQKLRRMLGTYLRDERAWHMQPDATYIRGDGSFTAQAAFMTDSWGAEGAEHVFDVAQA